MSSLHMIALCMPSASASAIASMVISILRAERYEVAGRSLADQQRQQRDRVRVIGEQPHRDREFGAAERGFQRPAGIGSGTSMASAESVERLTSTWSNAGEYRESVRCRRHRRRNAAGCGRPPSGSPSRSRARARPAAARRRRARACASSPDSGARNAARPACRRKRRRDSATGSRARRERPRGR